MNHATLHFDGACAPNPGPMGVGYTLSILDPDAEGRPRVIGEAGARLGHGTNNRAEYEALLAGLRHALRLGVRSIEVLSDSRLVVMQVQGHWKVRGRLRRLQYEALTLLGLFDSFTIVHVPREENEAADALSRTVCLIQPPLPSPSRGTSRFPRKLYGWQAALMRQWWKHLRHRPSALPILSRTFQIADSVIDAILKGQSYRDSTMDDLWSLSELPVPTGSYQDVAM